MRVRESERAMQGCGEIQAETERGRERERVKRRGALDSLPW